QQPVVDLVAEATTDGRLCGGRGHQIRHVPTCPSYDGAGPSHVSLRGWGRFGDSPALVFKDPNAVASPGNPGNGSVRRGRTFTGRPGRGHGACARGARRAGAAGARARAAGKTGGPRVAVDPGPARHSRGCRTAQPSDFFSSAVAPPASAASADSAAASPASSSSSSRSMISPLVSLTVAFSTTTARALPRATSPTRSGT